MSKDDAEAWLSNLEEKRKKHLQRQMRGTRRYHVEKDW